MVTVSGDEQVAFATVRTTLDPATDFDLGQISLRAGVSLVTVFNQPQSSLVLPRTTLFGLKDDLEKGNIKHAIQTDVFTLEEITDFEFERKEET